MSGKIISLDQLEQGQVGIIKRVGGKGALRRRLVDMGFTQGAGIEMVKTSPLGDPVEYLLRGYHLSLRKSEAQIIQVEVRDEFVPHRHHRSLNGSTQPLLRIKSGQKVIISKMRGRKRLRRRMKDLGLVPDTEIEIVKNDFSGPIIIAMDDENNLAIGKGMARHILVKPA